MVVIGDELELENGEVVEVLDIQENDDGRYIIKYAGVFLEGDMRFKVIK